MVAAALLLGTAALRRIWSSGGGPADLGEEDHSIDPDPQDTAEEEAKALLVPSSRGNRGRGLPEQLVDQILTYSMEHPAAGARTIAAAMGTATYGEWSVSHSAVYGLLKRHSLNRRSDRLAAVE
jgi:hypothetical protein